MALIDSFQKPSFNPTEFAQKLIDTYGHYSNDISLLIDELNEAMFAIRNQDLNKAINVLQSISLEFESNDNVVIFEYIYKQLTYYYRIEVNELKWERMHSELLRKYEEERIKKEQKEQRWMNRKLKIKQILCQIVDILFIAVPVSICAFGLAKVVNINNWVYITLSVIAITLLLHLTLHKRYSEKEMLDYVQFCTQKRYNNMDIYDRFFIAKKDLNISTSYELDYKTDAVVVKQILSDYQKNMNDSFVNGEIEKIKFKKIRIYELEAKQQYFMFTLNKFLYSKVSKPERSELFKYSGSEQADLFNTKNFYKLTEIGVVYFKLYYISLLSIKNNTNFETILHSPDKEIEFAEKSLHEGYATFYQQVN